MGCLSQSAGAVGLHKLVRRKQGIARNLDVAGGQLSRELKVPQLLAIGIGTTIGAGIFILIGTVAKERSGPALPLSFLVAGTAAALSGLSYAELASRLPSAGSAYHYAYTCLGEGLAWLVGWSLILEYTVSGATVARGVSPNLALFFGDNLPFWIVRRHIAGTNIMVDPCAGILIVIITLLLCTGIKQSAAAQVVMTSALVLILLFVDVVGTWIGFQNGWRGYELTTDGYLPFGVNGVLGGAATLFFSYVGFDALATTAEEVKNPQVDLPIGIGLALFICASLYMSVSAVVVGIVPYYLLDSDTPIATAFSQNGIHWAMYIVGGGALCAMLTTLLGCSLPQPRILMSMSRDGLLPAFFGVIHKSTSVPVNSAITTATIATLMAVFMNVEQLSEMVSVGTLMAFTAVGLCILTIRYVPPRDVHFPVESQEDSSTPGFEIADTKQESAQEDDPDDFRVDLKGPLLLEDQQNPGNLISPQAGNGNRRLAAVSIFFVVFGSILLSLSLSVAVFPGWLQWAGAIIGGVSLATGSAVLILSNQDESHQTFGNSGGFQCPLVPVLPILSILINIYLLVNVGSATWIRVSVWLLVGALVYLFYGVHHSIH